MKFSFQPTLFNLLLDSQKLLALQSWQESLKNPPDASLLELTWLTESCHTSTKSTSPQICSQDQEYFYYLSSFPNSLNRFTCLSSTLKLALISLMKFPTKPSNCSSSGEKSSNNGRKMTVKTRPFNTKSKKKPRKEQPAHLSRELIMDMITDLQDQSHQKMVIIDTHQESQETTETITK